ncbi:MAG: hypothetical protein QGH83_06085 [Candidatus Pacebacteria bacterium]|nr:hypothetical protein [Candidatus Paceibacterota bacterium]
MEDRLKFTDDEWSRLMWATNHLEVERIYKEAYARRIAEGYPRESFDRLQEVENYIIGKDYEGDEGTR